MRLEKIKDGSVRLSQLSPWDLRTFRSLPALADFSDHPGAERRLLPPPAVEQDFTPEMGMDWVEHVVPELRDSFAHNLGTVMADLENVEPDLNGGTPHPAAAPEGGPMDGEDLGGGSHGKAIADSSPPGSESSPEDASGGSPQSFSARTPFPKSNSSPEAASDKPLDPVPPPQETFTVNIPADHTEHWFRAMNQARIVLSAKHGIDSEHQPDLASLLTSGTLEHWFQYELFVSLQGWLVEVVMDPG